MKRILLLLTLAVLAPLRADLIVTTNGAQIVGNIVGIADGRIEVATTYAGRISVLLTTVRSISMSRPMVVQLADGTQLEGTLSGGDGGMLRLVSPTRTVQTRIADLRSFSEPTSALAPGRQASPPQWSYEVGANANGRTGNKDVIGASVSVRASRITARDTLALRASYDRQSTSGALSSDQLKAGVDFQRSIGRRTLWYLRDDAGYDNVRDLSLYSIAAGGLGYDVIKRPALRITARGGLSFRYEDFGNPATADVSALGGDLGLANTFAFKGTSLVNRVTYVRSFDRDASYRLSHESYYEVPTTLQHLRMRLGLTHDYNSRVGAGVEKLDTSYFAQLVFLWQ